MAFNAKKYGVPEFKDLKTSTRTIMVYGNVEFNQKEVFKYLPITHVEAPLTSKNKKVDKKKLFAPKGAIISVQYRHYLRGLDTRGLKNQKCPSCRVKKIKNGVEKEVATLQPIFVKCENEEFPKGTRELNYIGTCCGKTFNFKQLQKHPNFRNQVTILISIGNINLNVMMFKDKLKVAGCKENENIDELIKMLWDKYLSKQKDKWSLKKGFSKVEFLIDLVMRNLDFKLNFDIDRIKLNTMMNLPKYEDKIFLSQAENHSSVNIKMYSTPDENYKYKTIVYSNPNSIRKKIEYRDENIFLKKKTKSKYNTFIVFSSACVILSGKYPKDMENVYKFFVTEMIEHKSEVIEVVETREEKFKEHVQESIYWK